MIQKMLLTLGIGSFLLFGFWGFFSQPSQADELKKQQGFQPTPTMMPSVSPSLSPTGSPSPSPTVSPDLSPSPSPSPTITPKA